MKRVRRRGERRTTRALLAVVVACFAIVGVASSVQPREQLQIGMTVERALAVGETHDYELSLTAGDFARLAVQQPGSTFRFGVLISVFAPDGTFVQEASGFRLPRFPLWLAVEAAGRYRLRVELAPGASQPGRYALRVEETRPATERDRLSFAASRALAEARRLERKPAGDGSHVADAFRRARTLFQQADEPLGEAHVLMAQAPFSFDGDIPKKVETLEQARPLWRALGDREMEAVTTEAIGTFLGISLGRPREGIAALETARAIWHALNDREQEAGTLSRLSDLYVGIREFQRAIESANRALSIFRSIGSAHEDNALIALALVYSRWGDFDNALSYFEQAQDRIRMSGNRYREAANLLNISGHRASIRDFTAAAARAEEALAISRALGDRTGELSALVQLANMQLRRGEVAAARERFNEALAYHRTVTRNVVQQATLLSNVADTYRQESDHTKALEALEQALSLFPHRNSTRFRFLHGIAALYWTLGDQEKARDYYERMLEETRAVRDVGAEAFALAGIARFDRAAGNLDDARRRLEAALAAAESYRSALPGPEARTSYSPRIRLMYDSYIDVLMELHARNPARGLDAEAFSLAEMGRARSLLDLLADARADVQAGIDPKLLAEKKAVARRLNEAADRQMKVLAGPHTERQAEERAAEVRALSAEHGLVLARIRASSPRYAALTQPTRLNLADVRERVLDPETVLLEYVLGDQRSFVWAITRESLVSAELPKRAEIEASARLVYDLLTVRNRHPMGETPQQRRARLAKASAAYQPAAVRLSRMVLGPVAPLLGRKRLLIVADGALQYIPFGALPDPASLAEATTSVEPLITRHEIVDAPSASTVAVLRAEMKTRPSPPKGVAVIADPVFDADDPRVRRAAAPLAASIAKASAVPPSLERALVDVGLPMTRGSGIPRLAFSRREADAIAAVAGPEHGFRAIDFQANRATATSPDLGRYGIVHFATHSLLNDDAPELSGIVMSLVDRQGKPQSGFLRLNEIYELNLPVDLVVLSACQTALGKEIRGEGLIGLTRGFMYAGASRVVASLWKVDDAATAALIGIFYKRMLADRLPPAAALRAAQIELSRQTRWRDPYYWAAFQLQGEWK